MFAYEDRKVPERKRSVLSVDGGGASRGRRLTDAGIRTRRCPDFCGAWQAVTTTPAGVGKPGGLKASSRHRSIDRVRKALFPETGWVAVRRPQHCEVVEESPKNASGLRSPEAVMLGRC